MPVTAAWLQDNALYLLLALGTIFNIFWLFRFQDRLKMKWWAILIISVLHTVYGVLTVKVFAFAEAGFDSSSLGNMSIFGGVFLMPLAYFLGAKLFKRKPSEVFDIFTICMMFTLMCARITCIISGCCKGCLIFGSETARWPTRELEIIFYIVLLIIFGRRVKRSKSHGELYPAYMFLYGAFRFVTEFFRETDNQLFLKFHLSHIWAIAAMLLGGFFYWYITMSKPKKSRAQKKKP